MSNLVQLPQRFDIAAVDRFTRELVSPQLKPVRHHSVLDFGRLGFIDGSGITVLSNTIEWLISAGAEVSFENYQDLRKLPIAYLDDCGFFKRYLGIPLSGFSKVRNTTLPCVSVETARAFSWIERNFSTWFQYEMNCGYEACGSLRTCLKELFNNIGDHSTRNTGFVHAQHFPNQKQIRITVSDFGVGIPATIRTTFPNLSDAGALTKACEEGVTSQSRPNNMGLGLSYLVDTITANHGEVRIRSLTGAMLCEDRRGIEKRRSWIGRGLYPGTLIELSLDTRMFEGDSDERGDVEWW